MKKTLSSPAEVETQECRQRGVQSATRNRAASPRSPARPAAPTPPHASPAPARRPAPEQGRAPSRSRPIVGFCFLPPLAALLEWLRLSS